MDADLPQNLHGLVACCASGNIVQPSSVGGGAGKKTKQPKGLPPVPVWAGGAGGGGATGSSPLLKLKPNVVATRLRTQTMKQYNNAVSEADKAWQGFGLV